MRSHAPLTNRSIVLDEVVRFVLHVLGSAERAFPYILRRPPPARRAPVPDLRAQGHGEQLRAQAQGEAARQADNVSPLWNWGAFWVGSRLGLR